MFPKENPLSKVFNETHGDEEAHQLDDETIMQLIDMTMPGDIKTIRQKLTDAAELSADNKSPQLIRFSHDGQAVIIDRPQMLQLFKRLGLISQKTAE